MHDKLSVSGTALDSARATDKEDETHRAETMKPARKVSEEAEDGERKVSAGLSPTQCLRAKRMMVWVTPLILQTLLFSDSTGGKKTSRSASQSQRGDLDERPRVSIETPACEKSLEENKDSMVVEVLQMYNAQQEKLQSTLRKQQQLEKVLTFHVRHVSLTQHAVKNEDWCSFFCWSLEIRLYQKRYVRKVLK